MAAPLRLMGAVIETDGGTAPIRIEGRYPLSAIDYTLPVASAQLKSALLLAGLRARGTTIVRSPGPSRDHTERMLITMGVAVERDAGGAVSLSAPEKLQPIDAVIPGDFSSAAFFVIAGLLAAPNGLLIRNVGVNPTRNGLLAIVEAMGGAYSTPGAKKPGQRTGCRSLRHPRRSPGNRNPAGVGAACH